MKIDIDKFDRCNVLVVGDLMIDEYIWGEVDRISPEAPVPIVLVKNEDFTLGGSGNVVHNLVALGANVSAIGVIGFGLNGKRLLKKFDELGVDTEGIIQEPNRSTTQKIRIIATGQQVLRIDRETRDQISNQTFGAVSDFVEKIISKVDVVLISDYGKGFLTPALVTCLLDMAKKHTKMTIADPKGPNFSKYAGVSLLTPNKKEAGLAAGIEIIDQSALFEAGNRILETVDIGKLLITCGKEGMVLFERGEKPCQILTEVRQVYDVSGAGDTVIAVLGLSIASKASLEEGISLANAAAGIVVGKVGTATVSKKELISALKLYHESPADK